MNSRVPYLGCVGGAMGRIISAVTAPDARGFFVSAAATVSPITIKQAVGDEIDRTP